MSGNGLIERVEQIVGDGSGFKEVPENSNLISSGPMASFGYANCNGVVLLNCNNALLSHYSHQMADVNLKGKISDLPYLPILAANLRSHSGSDISGVLIGGAREHYEANLAFLKNERIPLVGTFFDEWGEKDNDIRFKDVLVIPRSKEVIVRSSGHYVKVH